VEEGKEGFQAVLVFVTTISMGGYVLYPRPGSL
jgi:hypothetical protein